MKYSEILLAKIPNADATLKKAIKHTDCLVEELKESHKEKIEKFLIALTGEMNGGHFCEDSAHWAIARMKPVALFKDDIVVKASAKDYLPMVGLTAEAAHEKVRKAQETAKAKARTLGFEAPSIPETYNKYDYLVTMAMVLSDDWLTTLGDMDKVAELAYQFLSDPDADDHHIWDYLMD